MADILYHDNLSVTSGSYILYHDKIAPPVVEVSTNEATSVSYDTAVLNGNLDDLGLETNVEVWFEFWEDVSASTHYETTKQTKSAIGSFNQSIPESAQILEQGKNYKFKAKAQGLTSGEPIQEGIELSFNTPTLLQQLLTDTVTLSEDTSVGWAVELEDSISLSETKHKKIDFPLADYLSLSDNVGINLSLLKQEVDDVLNLIDDIFIVNAKIVEIGDEINLSDEIFVNIPIYNTYLDDTITLSDEIHLNLTRETALLNDVISISEDISVSVIKVVDEDDTLSLSEEITVLRSVADVEFDIRTHALDVKGAQCDIRVYEGQINNANCDIRVLRTPSLNDTNCDIRVMPAPEPGQTSFEPRGLEHIKVKLAGNWLEDIDTNSLNCNWTSDETPGTCSFRIARYSDDYNRTLTGSSSPLDSDSIIEVYFDDELIWYGYIITIESILDTEDARVTCHDRKYKVQHNMQDMSYGRGGDCEFTGVALTHVLDQLVTDTIISSYSDVPTGVVTELREQDGVPAGMLITELLDMSGNYKWNITPTGVLKIYTSGSGIIKQLPLANSDEQFKWDNIIDYNLSLNDKTNMVTTLEVILGTESARDYASYKVVSLQGQQLYQDWPFNKIGGFLDFVGETQKLTNTGQYKGKVYASPEEYDTIFRRFRVPYWTEGSFWDDTVPIRIEQGVLNKTWWIFKQGRIDGWLRYVAGQWKPFRYSYNIANEVVTFAKRMFVPTEYDTYSLGAFMSGLWERIRFYIVTPVRIFGRFYKKETVVSASTPTIFDVNFVGIAGTGQKRRMVLSNLGVKESVAYRDYEDGELVYHTVLGYNDTIYATDRAKLMLSRINDPKTHGTINLTWDAWKYYGLDIGNRVNITNTKYNNIYKGNNGFPLDITEITFDAGTYQVSISTNRNRYYVASANLQTREEVI